MLLSVRMYVCVCIHMYCTLAQFFKYVMKKANVCVRLAEPVQWICPHVNALNRASVCVCGRTCCTCTHAQFMIHAQWRQMCMHAVRGTCDEYMHIQIIYERMCTSVCERPCVDAHAQFMICVAKKAYALHLCPGIQFPHWINTLDGIRVCVLCETRAMI